MTDMFDLEQSIADWRQQMSTRGISDSAVLDELESHLRDDFDQQLHSGLIAPQAFASAVQKIGQAAVLKHEFDKVSITSELHDRLKNAILTLAGIPNPSFATNMNTSNPQSNIEPRWATYVKGMVFLAPAAAISAFTMIFVFPKLQQLCQEAGVAIPAVYQFASFLRQYNVLIGGALLLALYLLESRSTFWPKYCRVSVGIIVFLLNAAALVLIAMMVVLAVL